MFFVTPVEKLPMPTFSLLTFNVYGVPAPGTSARLRTLTHRLNEEPFSVVCLQEVQAHPYRKLLLQATPGYHYGAYEPFVHAPKGGLLTLSRLALEQRDFILYRERGLWYTPAIADWLLHKGVLLTRMQIAGLTVVVLNTHLTANYMGNWGRGNAFAEMEHEQLMQLCEIIYAQPPDALVIVAGDLNIPRGSWLYDSFVSESRLFDPLAGHPEPTLRPRRGWPSRYFAAIDYTFLRVPLLHGVHVESRLRFEEPMLLSNGREAHLTDHLAVEVCVSWEKQES